MAKGKWTGRIPKLTPEVQAAIIADIAEGVPVSGPASAAPPLPLTRPGPEGSGWPFRDFCDALKKAEAAADSVARIRRVAQDGQVIERPTTTTTRDGSSTTKVVEKTTAGQWTADAWLLQRRHRPGRTAFGRRGPRPSR